MYFAYFEVQSEVGYLGGVLAYYAYNGYLGGVLAP